MAERRMFAKTIIDSDAFLDMPLSTQALYFHLSMRADDDGFLNNAKKIQRTIGANDDDFKILLGKNFIIPFEDGVCVVKHWLIHNYIQKDRYKETVYTEHKEKLSIKNNNVYTMDTNCIQDVSSLEAQVRLGEVSLGKSKVSKENHARGSRLPNDWIAPQQFIDFCNSERPDLNANLIAELFKDYWISVAGSKGVKADWFATWRNWVRRQDASKSSFKNKSAVVSDQQFDDWLNTENPKVRAING